MKKPKASAKDSTAELKQILGLSELPGLILVTAPDSIRLRRIEDALREKFAVSGAQVTHIRGESLNSETIARLADDAVTLSLFSGPRLYVISQVDRVASSSLKPLVAVLGALSPGVTFLCFSTPLAASHAVVGCAEKHGRYLAFPELSGEELTAWAARELKRNGVATPSTIVVERLVEYAEFLPDRVAQLASQLALYLDGEPASGDSIAALFPSSPVAGEFELIDSIAGGSPAKTELMFESLIRAGKSPFMLLGMIAKIFSNYHIILNELEHRTNPATIREQLRMTPWVFNKSMDAARRLKPQDLERHLRAIVRADSKLKNKSLGAETIFSELFRNLRPLTRENHA